MENKIITQLTDDDIYNVGIINSRPVFVTATPEDAAAIIHCGGCATTCGKITDEQIAELGDALRVSSDARQGRYAKGVADPDGLEGDYPDGIEHASDMTAEELMPIVRKIIREVKQPHNMQDYAVRSFMSDMEKWHRGCIPTGFPTWDKFMGGGLHDGLYVIAGGTSTGKTTFAWQLADQIAMSGHHVVYWSLEMSRREMLIKSISRMSGISTERLTAADIPEGTYNRMAETLTDWAEQIGNRMQVIEGGFNTSIADIEHETKRYCGEVARPVVIVDYLQIVKPRDKRPTKKEELDEIVSALKIMSRDLHIPVVLVSSINRNNYMKVPDYTAIAGSGGIEYTADCIVALQLECAYSDMTYATKAGIEKEKLENNQRITFAEGKRENPRKIRMSGLKNRAGVGTFEIDFVYDTKTNQFSDRGEHESLTDRAVASFNAIGNAPAMV